MNAERCVVPVSFSVLLILAVILTVLFSVPGISSGGALPLGSRETRTEAHMGPEAALDSVLHVLPPLGVNTGDIIDFDRTLTEFLAVTVCEVDAGGGCTTVREFTSQKNSGTGLDYINLQHHRYHVNWNVAKSDLGKVFEIRFTAAGLDVGHIAYTPATGRTVPIKFRIDNHPRIRTRVLREQGLSAIEIATALRDEFDLNQAEIEKLLLVEDFSHTEVAEALIIVFDLTPPEAAELMYQYGFDATEIATIIKSVFSLNQDEVAQLLLDLNFSPTEVAKALIIVFDLTPPEAAGWMHQYGFDATEIAAVLRDAFDLNRDEIAKLLRDLNFSPTEVAETLIIVFDLPPDEAAGLMYQYGLNATEIATILRSLFDLNPDEIAKLLRDLNFSRTEITEALIIVFDLNPDEAAEWMVHRGFNATEIATILRNAFILDQDEIAQLLSDLDLSRREVAEAVVRVFFPQVAGEAAKWMKSFGCPGRETYNILMLVFHIQDEILVENILFDAGYKMEEFIDFTAFESVKRFTPVLYFDKTLHSLPMDAADYFRVVMHDEPGGGHTSPRFDDSTDPSTVIWEAAYYGPPTWNDPEIILLPVRDRYGWYMGMQNHGDDGWLKLINGEVPTYYMVISDIDPSEQSPPGPKGRLRIAYWWFYGFQEYCNSWECTGPAGEHYGDWEHIIVTTDPARTRADAVTYFFHKDWYTRPWPAFPTDGERPGVYVGKLAHGSYHSQEEGGFGDDGISRHPWHCCEYADWRNPTENTKWYNAHENLISLRDTLYWMRADQVGSSFLHNGKEYIVQNWRWGTSVPSWDYKDLVCKWVHHNAVGTHPTTAGLDWTLASCERYGCQGYHDNCAYSINPNLGWPWDNPAPALSNASEERDGSGDSSVAGSEPVQIREVSLALEAPNPLAGVRLAGTFSIPRAMDANLEIYDVSGRLMTSIVNRRVGLGVHVFEWDLGKPSGSRVAPGIYFLRLDTPERTITQKIVIQR